jgi:hypothetical protein
VISLLFKEIIYVYSENHTKPINTFSVQNAKLPDIKAGGTYNYHRTSESLTYHTKVRRSTNNVTGGDTEDNRGRGTRRFPHRPVSERLKEHER